MSLQEIQTKIREYSQINNALLDVQREMESEYAKIKKQYTPVLIQKATKLKNLRQEILELIDINRHLFDRPKTQSLYGITFGLRKKKGTLKVAKNTVDLIKKHFKDDWQQFIQVKESVMKSALNRLDARTLRKIGVTVENDTEVPLVKSDFDKIEKFIDALLKEE